MIEIEQIKRYIERTKMDERDRYQMDVKTTMALAHKASEAAIDAIVIAFEYGKAKGYRAAKAEVRA